MRVRSPISCVHPTSASVTLRMRGQVGRGTGEDSVAGSARRLIVVAAMLIGASALVTPPADALESGGCSKDGLVMIGPINGGIACTFTVACPSTSTSPCALPLRVGVTGIGTLSAFVLVTSPSFYDGSGCGPASSGCATSGTLLIAPGNTATVTCVGATSTLALLAKVSCT